MIIHLIDFNTAYPCSTKGLLTVNFEADKAIQLSMGEKKNATAITCYNLVEPHSEHGEKIYVLDHRGLLLLEKKVDPSTYSYMY